MAALLAQGASGAKHVGADCTITSIDVLEQARAGSLCFARSAETARTWLASSASAMLLSHAAWSELQAGAGFAFDENTRCVLLVSEVDLALILLLQQLPAPAQAASPGVHATAVVHASARVAASASVGPYCVVEAGAVVGARSVLQAYCFVGNNASVGEDCRLHPRVAVLATCVVGNRCQLHSGVVLGADGFGYRPHPQGKGLLKIPHVGNVVLGDDVEVGANTCIDRGKLGATSVGSGTKIDNLVQIGHNVTIGRSCIICGNVGIAGSAVLEDGAVLGGGANIRDNIRIGRGAQIAAASAVAHDVLAGETQVGMPAMPIRQWSTFYKAMLRLSKAKRGTTGM